MGEFGAGRPRIVCYLFSPFLSFVPSFFLFKIYTISLANKLNSTYHRLNFDNHRGGGEAEDRMTQSEIAPLSGDQTVASLA